MQKYNSKKIQSVGGIDFLKDNNLVDVNWVLLRQCNYRCSYCPVHRKESYIPSKIDLENAVNQLKCYSDNKYRITLTGGEPTIHKQYLWLLGELFSNLEDQVFKVTTVTNLSFRKEWLDEFTATLPSPTNENVAFAASYHFEFADEVSFRKNAVMLAESGFRVNIQVLAHPEHMDVVRRIADFFKESTQPLLNIEVKIVRQDFGPHPDNRYRPEDLDWLRSEYAEKPANNILVTYVDNGILSERYFTANELIVLGENRFEGMLCDAGIRAFSIDIDGSVDRAVCFREVRTEKPNIFKGENVLDGFSEPVVCPFTACACLSDLRLPKVRI